jgi:hypothetical protein
MKALLFVSEQISNCLRVSSLFENVCAIGIFRVLSHHFVPVAIPKGETFIREGELGASDMPNAST